MDFPGYHFSTLLIAGSSNAETWSPMNQWWGRNLTSIRILQVRELSIWVLFAVENVLCFSFWDIWETQVNVNSLQTSESGVATQISVLPWCTPERHKLCLTPLVLFKTPSCDEFKKWSNKPPCPLHIQLWQTLTLQVAKPAKQSMHAFPSGRPTWVEPRSALVICGGKLLVVRGRGLPGLRKVFLA